MKSTAILGILGNHYFVFESWGIDSSDQIPIQTHINRLSENHPTIPIWRYVVLKRQREKGFSFPLTDYDKKVFSNPQSFLNSQYKGDWSEVNYLDLMTAKRLAKQSLEF